MLYQIPLPVGSIVMDSSQNGNDDLFAYKSSSKLIFKTESFVSPFTIFYADFAEFRDRPIQLKVFRQGKVRGLDIDAFEVKQVGDWSVLPADQMCRGMAKVGIGFLFKWK